MESAANLRAGKRSIIAGGAAAAAAGAAVVSGGNAGDSSSIAAAGSLAVPAYVKSISGSIGGLVEACALQPVDTIKTRLQLDSRGQYKGMVDCGKTVVNTEGVRALWKGLTPFATHLTCKYAVRMGTNGVLNSILRNQETGKLDPKWRFFSGFAAGSLEAVMVVTPFEVVKIRLQQQRGLDVSQLRYKNPIHCAKTIVAEEGVLAMWSGVLPTVCRNGTNQAFMFSAKYGMDSWLWNKQDGSNVQLKPWQSMVSGFIAGTIGPVVTGPLDVVKTRLMAQDKFSPGGPKYKGMVHALSTVYKEEGLRALWKGFTPRLLRMAPGQAITWGVADQIVQAYEKSLYQGATMME